MARSVSKHKDKHGTLTVDLDLAALDLARKDVAYGLVAFGESVLSRADVPDQPVYGKGLVEKGATGVWVDGQKIGGDADLPKGEKADGIVGFVGFGFPAHFNELGTVNQPARPFLTPAVMAAASEGEAIIARGARKR